MIFFFSDLVNNDPDSSPQSKSAFLQRFIRRLRSDDLDTDLNLRTLVPRDYNSGKKIFNKDVIIMHNVTYRHGALYLKGEGTGSSPKKNFGRKSTSFLYVYHLDTVSLVSCFSVFFFILGRFEGTSVKRDYGINPPFHELCRMMNMPYCSYRS